MPFLEEATAELFRLRECEVREAAAAAAKEAADAGGGTEAGAGEVVAAPL